MNPFSTPLIAAIALSGSASNAPMDWLSQMAMVAPRATGKAGNRLSQKAKRRRARQYASQSFRKGGAK